MSIHNREDPRRYPIRPHVGVGGIVEWKDSLLLIRRKFPPDQGKWAIPGGHLELGESTTAGALREVQEETGLRVKNPRFASVIDKIEKDRDGKIEFHYVLIDFFFDLVDIPPPLPSPKSDVLEARFVKIVDLLHYDLTNSIVELFRKLHYI